VRSVVYKERSFVEYTQDLRNRTIRILVAMCIVTIFCLFFSITIYDFNGYKIPLPHPDIWNNISVQTIHLMKSNLLPQNVNLIQLTPQGPFLTEIYSALMLSIILVMPIFVRELAGFIGPGLYHSEKTVVKKFTAYALGLFAGGCLFSYFIVIPSVLSFLYKYGQAVGISTFFDIGEFIPFVMQFLIIFGVSYQLPIIMWALTVSGIVEYTFWRSKLRYAIAICTIFGAFITPDGSGVTMWFIAGPMILLYVIGMLVIEIKIKRRQQQDQKQQVI
jgi:sec-independent protein translocase protein TatC